LNLHISLSSKVRSTQLSKNGISIRLEMPHLDDSTNMANFIGGSGFAE
jgi:hypothetical protein